MKYVSRDVDGVVNGIFSNPQPDAFDESGNLLCAGIVTQEVADDAPELLEYVAKMTVQSVP